MNILIFVKNNKKCKNAVPFWAHTAIGLQSARQNIEQWLSSAPRQKIKQHLVLSMEQMDWRSSKKLSNWAISLSPFKFLGVDKDPTRPILVLSAQMRTRRGPYCYSLR